MDVLRTPRAMRWVALGLLLGWLWPAATAQADIIMKVLVVNPSETEVKEFAISSPLPPEVRPENILDADGLQVEYDSQAQAYVLTGTVVLKPKESLRRQVTLEDVWVIPPERFSMLRSETDELMQKLSGTPYEGRGRLLAQSIVRHLADIGASQEQTAVSPMEHINRYREDTNALQLVETDLVSLRQLMVMAALEPAAQTILAGTHTASGGAHERGRLSILATWRMIFAVVGLLGFISLSFFLVWQRQLKLQLAKQQAQDAASSTPPQASPNGNGIHAPDPHSVPSRLRPKAPLSSS